jgi:hypothetical protein
MLPATAGRNRNFNHPVEKAARWDAGSENNSKTLPLLLRMDE